MTHPTHDQTDADIAPTAQLATVGEAVTDTIAKTVRPRGESGGVVATRVSRIEISKIDLDATDFRHRIRLDAGPLAEKMALCGLVEPIIVQWLHRGLSYRVISGFRRVAAAIELGWARIPAIEWSGKDPREALVASVVGNEDRAPYNDLERAGIIVAWEAAGIDDLPITGVLRIGDRQKRNLLRLLRLPRRAREALVDPEHAFTSTHGLYLLRARAAEPDLDLDAWVDRIGADGLSVNRMRALLTPSPRALRPPPPCRLFAPDSDLDDGVVVLQRQTIHLDRLDDAERARLRRDLERLLAVLAAPGDG